VVVVLVPVISALTVVAKTTHTLALVMVDSVNVKTVDVPSNSNQSLDYFF
jgi:hypothetical protein